MCRTIFARANMSYGKNPKPETSQGKRDSSSVMSSSRKRLKSSLSDSKKLEARAKKPRKMSRKKEYNIGTAGEASHFYKFTGKQTRGWRKLDKNLHDYLVNLIDSSVKAVSSRPGFRKDGDVQSLLQTLKVRLKGELRDLKAPTKKYGDYSHLRSNLTNLTETLREMTDQKALLDQNIRQEERLIEQLECSGYQDEIDPELLIQVEQDQLNLPNQVSSIT